MSRSFPSAEQPDVKPVVGVQAIQVLHVFRALYPQSGGPLTYLRMVCDLTEGTEFVHDYATLEAAPEMDGVPRRAYGAESRRSAWINAYQLALWLWRHVRHYSIVHAHGMSGLHLPIAYLICRLRRVPLIAQPHGSLSPHYLSGQRGARAFFLRRILPAMLVRMTAVLVISPKERADVQALDAATRCCECPPWVPTNRTAIDSASVSEPIVLFVGRLAPIKRIPDLLTAFQHVWERCPAAKLLLVGEGGADYVQELKVHPSAQRAHFRGFLRPEDLPALYARASLLVLPSQGENFGFAAAEAMAAGLPVVVSADVGLADMVRRYGAGRVVKVGDVAGLGQAIAECLEPTRCSEMARAARQLVKQELCAEAAHEALERLYRGAICPTSAQPC